jgi:hypothetical protein
MNDGIFFLVNHELPAALFHTKHQILALMTGQQSPRFLVDTRRLLLNIGSLLELIGKSLLEISKA